MRVHAIKTSSSLVYLSLANSICNPAKEPRRAEGSHFLFPNEIAIASFDAAMQITWDYPHGNVSASTWHGAQSASVAVMSELPAGMLLSMLSVSSTQMEHSSGHPASRLRLFGL